MRHAACLPARLGGEGKTGIDALARASGRKPATRGCLFRFGEREGKALGVPARIAMRSSKATAPLQRREAAGRPARAQVRQRASGNERGKSASGSGQATPHPQERAARDRVRPPDLPLNFTLLPIVTRMGRDDRPGPRQRIERGRPQGSPWVLNSGLWTSPAQTAQNSLLSPATTPARASRRPPELAVST